MKLIEWEKIGTVGVDAGMIWVGDPCYVLGRDSSHGPKNWQEFCSKTDAHQDYSEPLGKGIGFAISSGYGDGSYAVYIRRSRESRVSAVKVVFIPKGE